MKEDKRKTNDVELLELVSRMGNQYSQMFADELLHFLQKTVLTKAEICTAISNFTVCRVMSKSSLTDPVSGFTLSAGRITSRLYLDVGCLHIFYVRNKSQSTLKHLELAKVHQVMLGPSTKEYQPCSRCESTLCTHLMRTDFS